MPAMELVLLLFPGKNKPGRRNRAGLTESPYFFSNKKYSLRTKKNNQMSEGKKGGAQSEVDIGLSPSEEMLPIALVKYVCIEVCGCTRKKIRSWPPSA